MTGCRLRVRVTPRGGADRIDKVDQDEDGRWRVHLRVRAAPADGQANAAVLAALARTLGIPKSRLRLTSGTSARLKTVEIDGLDETEALRRLSA